MADREAVQDAAAAGAQAEAVQEAEVSAADLAEAAARAEGFDTDLTEY